MELNRTISGYNGSLFCTSPTPYPDMKYKIFSASSLIISLVSALINTAFLLIVQRTKSYHANVHLLFMNFCLASLALSVHSLATSIYALSAIPFNLSFPALPCHVSHILYEVSSVAQVSFIWCLALERLMDNLMKRWTEREHATGAAQMLAGMSWVLGIGTYTVLTVVISMNGSEQGMLCFCHSLMSRPFWTMCIGLGACLTTYAVISVTYGCLYRRSVRELLIFSCRQRQDWTKHTSLTERYLLAKNVRLCQLWWPTLAIRFLVDLTCAVSSVYVRAWMEWSGMDIDPILYALLINNLIAIDTVCHPILLTMRESRLKRSAMNTFPFLNHCVQVEEDYSDMQQHSVEVDVATLTAFRKRSPTGETLELVDYRMNPEQHGNILNAMWSQCAR